MKEVEGRVAAILDKHRIAINVGSQAGICTGSRVTVWEEVTITDPISEEQLGIVRVDRIAMDVTEVHDKLCIASTGRPTFNLFPNMFSTSTRETIRAGSPSNATDSSVPVSVGQIVTIYLEQPSEAADEQKPPK